jgi:L-fucose isomerase
MKTSKIGIVMLNDEREHVWIKNNPENEAVLQKWAEVIKNGLKIIDGSMPEVVVGSKIITSVRIAQEIGEELATFNCKIIIIIYNVWNFPFFVWPFINSVGKDKPILSLSNNNGKYPGNVGLLATDGALRQAGTRTHRIIGNADDLKTQKKVFDWIRAAQSLSNIQNEVYGMYGGHSMGMETGYFHLVPTIKTIGTTCYQIDQLWLEKKMDSIDEKEVEKGLNWFENLLGKRIKYDGKILTPETLKTQIRLYLAIRQVNEENGFDFCGLKGQRELTEYICLGDIAEMLLNDPYDWKGKKEPTVCATEADAYAAITMQLLKYISGGLPILFMDVRLYHPDKDIWDFCNSGNHASWYASQSFNPTENFKKITFHPALDFYFKAGGASVEFNAAPGQMTFARLGLWDDKLYMVIVRGESLDLSDEERRKLNEQTDPTWPHVHARLNCSFDEFLSTFPCNHILGVAGDYINSLICLCEISGITPIILGEDERKRIKPIWEHF